MRADQLEWGEIQSNCKAQEFIRGFIVTEFEEETVTSSEFKLQHISLHPGPELASELRRPKTVSLLHLLLLQRFISRRQLSF